jgi:hypothetical protein
MKDGDFYMLTTFTDIKKIRKTIYISPLSPKLIMAEVMAAIKARSGRKIRLRFRYNFGMVY